MFTRRIILFVVVTLAATGFAQSPRIVRLTTADDVGISAGYYAPETNPAPGVILVHSLGKNRDEWSAFVPLLHQAGFAVLSFDLRGHGDSTRRLTAKGPVNLDYHNFTARDYQDMLLDVDAAYNWLAKQPDVDSRRVAVVGSSVGANLALRYAAFNEDVAAFLLFSPGIIYKDIRTDDVIGKVGKRPLRIVVARQDGFAFESSKRLIELRPEAGTNDLMVCTGGVHGAGLLSTVKQLPALTVAWLRQALDTGTSPP